MKSDNYLKLTIDKCDEYNKEEMLDYVSVEGNKESVSKAIIKRLVSDDLAFSYFNNLIKKGENNLKISSNQEAKIVSISTNDALSLLTKMNDLNTLEKQRLELLEGMRSLKILFRKYREANLSIKVGDEKVTISCNDIMKIFFSSNEEFLTTIKKEKILGVESHLFCLTMYKFLDGEKILQRYHIPRAFIERFTKLKQQEFIDFESIMFTKRDYKNIYNIDISEKLKQIILKDMNENYSKLEKSIYIYIKLCRLFSYDPDFYINNQQGEIAIFHQDLSRIPTIDNSNEAIVCYEFNMIFSRFLQQLDIPYYLNVKSDLEYGQGHANLDYVVDKFIVFADSVTSILDGDLVNAKLNLELKGLKCVNKCLKTKKEFNAILKRVYMDIVKCEEGDKLVDQLKEYRKVLFTSRRNITYLSKAKFLINKMKSSKMKIVDSIGYLMKLKKMMFTSLELEQNISFIVLKSTLGEQVSPGIVITVNEQGNIKDGRGNSYWYYHPNGELIKISSEQIYEFFQTNKFSYLNSSKKRIPGIFKKDRKGNRCD